MTRFLQGAKLLRSLFVATLLVLPLSSLKAAAAYDNTIKALESEVEAIAQQARSVKLSQELIEERLHNMENSLEKLRRDLASLEQRQVSSSSSALSPVAPANQEALKKWQQQTDSNIKHLQEALQTLAGALGNSSSSTNTDTGLYVVKSGDSLEKIAKKHAVSIEAIKELNQLKSNTIQIGQKLKLPPAKS